MTTTYKARRRKTASPWLQAVWWTMGAVILLLISVIFGAWLAIATS